MKQFLANVFLALTWCALSNSFAFGDFLFGFIVGLVLLYCFGYLRKKAAKKTPPRLYIVKVWLCFKLLVIFIRELIISCVRVFWRILRGDQGCHPAIIEYNTELKTPLQITLLANMITLTPGTISVDISDDNKIIYVHVLKLDTEESMCESIRKDFERNIKEVSEL